MLRMGLWQRTHITDNEMFSSLAKKCFLFSFGERKTHETGSLELFLLSFGVLTKRYQQSVLFRNVYKFLRHIALPFHDAFIASTFLFKYFQTNDRRISTWSSYFASHLTFRWSFSSSSRKQISAFSSTDLRSSIGFTASAAGNEGVEGSNHYLISRFPSISPGFGADGERGKPW